ncbi:MAG: hypothetical protein E6Q99_08985 [Elusimicrobia bacterium]|nr:MAG: hypothetical protein E6Q99_08985 [Elusimicrobiota bacterium]
MRSFRAIALAGSLICFALGTWLLSLSDQEIVALITELTGYDKPEKIARQLTASRLLLLRALPFAAAALCSLIAWRPQPLLAVVHYVHDALAFGREQVRASYRSLLPWERAVWAVGCVLLAVHNAVNIVQVPAMVDEAMTWLLFTSRGPLVSATFYAAPNNHILHSLLTNLTSFLPGDPLVVMRIPTLFVGTATMALLYLLLRRVGDRNAALLSWSMVVASTPFLYYAYLSRGYMLVLFWMVTATGATLALHRSGDKRAFRVLALACTGGLFTMPSFLYPASILYAYLFFTSGGTGWNRWHVVRSGIVMGTLTAVLYAPGVVMSGIEAFTNNQWVRPISRSEVLSGWFAHFESTFHWMTGAPFALFLCTGGVLAALLLGWRSRTTDGTLLAAVSVFASLAIPFLHSVIPFERTWIYLLVPLGLSFTALLSNRYIAMLRAPATVLLMSLSILGGAWRFARQLPTIEYMAYDAQRMYAAVESIEPMDIYCEYTVLGDHLVFDLRKRGRSFTYTLSPEGAERERYLEDPAYTLLLVRSNAPIDHPRYRQLYADGIQRVYVPK